MAGGTVTYTPKFGTESYTLVATQLNSGIIMGSMGGVYWPHQYLYCMKRTEIANNPQRHIYYSSNVGGGSTPHYYQMIGYAISNSDWVGSLSVDPTALTADDRYNFLDPTVEINLYDGVPDSTNILYYSAAETGGYDTIYCASPSFSLNLLDPALSPANILNQQNGISLIKTFYYADEGVTDGDTYSSNRHLKRYSKAVYNTDDPLFERNDTEGPITTLVAGQPVIAYSLDTPEVEILKSLFGTIVRSDSGYIKEKYDDFVRSACRDIYLSTTTTRRIFLRDSQPNTLTNDDLQYLQKYTEFNANIVSMLTTRSFMGTSTAPSTTSGGSY
tara:strand:- start:8327 stop:9316 length:990 start_codon:yes stop_codon:yes gene_type:complete